MIFLQRIKRAFFPVLMLLWLFYLPLALVVYTPYSYWIYCHWNIRCTYLDAATLDKTPRELSAFFRHQRPSLNPPWSAKETQHMLEVRSMYDWALLAFGLISVIFALDLATSRRLRDYHVYAKFSLRWLLGLALLMILIVPVFGVFWMKVFHPLLFANDLWRTDQTDISWYLMPKHYFLSVIFVLFSLSLLFNALLLRLLRPKLGVKTPDTAPSCVNIPKD
ncbi:DUF1461 domain-containing protein [Thiolinea disciformis]|uniref:lipoprotein intramolecular transacylase Lit n=1 Tax=Thiolinea disciformis TaxID=125614 RepID=UPI000364E606|nr:DUF1461 domain-containing protein [Thiolinea disciformis]